MLVLGLGSNLGDREQNLELAIVEIQKKLELADLKKSSLYYSRAHLLEGSPQNWDKEFCNMAVGGETSIEPTTILSIVKEIEHEIGRGPSPKWSPRLIDIDILGYGEMNYNSRDLTIPHKLLLERTWALEPFIEINPNWKYPVPGKYYQQSIKDIYSKIAEKAL